MSDRVQIGGGVLSNRGLEAAMKAHRDSVSPTNRQMIAEAIVAYQRNAIDLTSEGEVMDVRRRAKEAANAIGVTPYSDMRPFVEQAVVYALVSHEPGPTDTQERVSVTDAELIAALRREAELFVDDPKPIATMRLAADRLEAALPSGVRVTRQDWDIEATAVDIARSLSAIDGGRFHEPTYNAAKAGALEAFCRILSALHPEREG